MPMAERAAIFGSGHEERASTGICHFCTSMQVGVCHFIGKGLALVLVIQAGGIVSPAAIIEGIASGAGGELRAELPKRVKTRVGRRC